MSAVTPSVVGSAVLAPAAVESFRTLLQTLRAECVQEQAEMQAAAAQDSLDPVVSARGSSLQRTLEEIDAALLRVEAGTYGACTSCGAAIPEERLELRPFASSCVACASAR